MAMIENAKVINVRLSEAQVISVDELVQHAREGTRGRIIRQLLDEALAARKAAVSEGKE